MCVARRVRSQVGYGNVWGVQVVAEEEREGGGEVELRM